MAPFTSLTLQRYLYKILICHYQTGTQIPIHLLVSFDSIHRIPFPAPFQLFLSPEKTRVCHQLHFSHSKNINADIQDARYWDGSVFSATPRQRTVCTDENIIVQELVPGVRCSLAGLCAS